MRGVLLIAAMVSIKQRLLDAIEQTPEPLLEETLAFLESRKAASDSQDSPVRPASGRSLSRHARKWAGDNLRECLDAVYDSRGGSRL